MSLIEGDDDQPVIDENKKYLDDLVGDGKKFKDHEALARGKWHADKTIEIMEKRMDALRTDYQKEREQNITRAQLEEVIEKFSKQPLASNANPLVNEEKPSMFDPAQLESLVETNFQKMKEKDRQEDNYKTVQNMAIARYGNNYKQHLTTTMSDLGLTPQELETMARTNPKVFIKTFGLEQQPGPGFQAPPRSNINPPFRPTNSNHNKWSYYEELRRTKPEEYHSQKTQNKMMEDYAALGDDFEDGNFERSN